MSDINIVQIIWHEDYNQTVPQSPDGEEHFGDLYIVEKEVIYHHNYNQFSPLTNHHKCNTFHI